MSFEEVSRVAIIAVHNLLLSPVDTDSITKIDKINIFYSEENAGYNATIYANNKRFTSKFRTRNFQEGQEYTFPKRAASLLGLSIVHPIVWKKRPQ